MGTYPTEQWRSGLEGIPAALKWTGGAAVKEEYSICLRSGRGLMEVWQVSVDGMSGVGGGIGGGRQVERLWYLLFIPPSGSLSESVSPKICQFLRGLGHQTFSSLLLALHIFG